MDWATRVTIPLGAARGLEYLHEAATLRIFLHRDIKSTNILDVKVHILDVKVQGEKITYLGMVKHLMNEDHASCSSSPASSC